MFSAPPPYLEIVEEPKPKLRFRYKCEGRAAGSILGVTATAENKTFPAVRIVGYTGRAVIVVSCVTKDFPYRPHPYFLVGTGCKKGVCTVVVPTATMTVYFENLGIQCPRKIDFPASMSLREEIRVDPFNSFAHDRILKNLDLAAVRLCFQTFLEGPQRGRCTVPLAPVVSSPIYDKRCVPDLVIVKLSDCVAPVDGGRKDLIVLCEKVTKEDIQIRFFELKDGEVVWEAFGDFLPTQVHKQVGIWFRPPAYHTTDVSEPVKVFLELRRPSDGATSAAIPFQLLPLGRDIMNSKQKPPKREESRNNRSPLQWQDFSKNPQILNPTHLVQHQEPPQWNLPGASGLQSRAVIKDPCRELIEYVGQGQELMHQQPLQWNLTGPSGLQSRAVVKDPLRELLDFVGQGQELMQISLKSSELSNLDMFDPNNLSASLSMNLSLTNVAVSSL